MRLSRHAFKADACPWGVHTVITPSTPLSELAAFFARRRPSTAAASGRAEPTTASGEGATSATGDWALVTDSERKFVLAVVTKEDLDK